MGCEEEIDGRGVKILSYRWMGLACDVGMTKGRMW